MEKKGLSRREFLGRFAAGVGATAAGLGAVELMGRQKDEEEPVGDDETSPEFMPIERNEFFDGNEAYVQTLTPKNGEWTKKQRKERRRILSGGEHIFDDVGFSFYLVQVGDTISEIREKLSRYPEFAHLADQTTKLDSFNIPAKKLRANMWIPIPIERKDRHLTEAQFVNYAANAIEKMVADKTYGEEVQRILTKVDERTLVATMMAIAKQEAGGEPLGKFALHRWENHQGAFSFSYFHVLMKGPGLKARRHLNLTEGQLFHPENAVRLFLAFMIEKSKESRKHADRLFPISENEEAFARFYNGKRWKQINPHYIENLRGFLEEADSRLSEDGRRWRAEIPVDSITADAQKN